MYRPTGDPHGAAFSPERASASANEQASALLEPLGLLELESLLRRLARQIDGAQYAPSGNAVELAGLVARNSAGLQAQFEREATAAILDSPHAEAFGAALAAHLTTTLTAIKGAKARAESLAEGATGAAPAPAKSLFGIVREVFGGGGILDRVDGAMQSLEAERRRTDARWRLIVLNEAHELLARLRSGVDIVVRRRGELRQLAAVAATTVRAQADSAVTALETLDGDLPPRTLSLLVSAVANEPANQARQLGLGAVAEVVAADADAGRTPEAAARIADRLGQQTDSEVVLDEDVAQLLGRLRSAVGRRATTGLPMAVGYLTDVALRQAPHQPMALGGSRANFQVLPPGARPILAVENGALGIARYGTPRRDRLGILHIQGDRRLDDIDVFAEARAALQAAETDANYRLLQPATGEPEEPRPAAPAVNHPEHTAGVPGTNHVAAIPSRS